MKKRKPNVIFIICFVILIAAVSVGVVYQVRQKQREKAYEKLAEEVVTEPVSEEEPEPESEPEPEKPEIPVDFAALQEQNPDIYAWIRIADTNVDYPILQSPGDDDYYLNHTVEGEEGLPGAIYTQYSYNSGCFTDNVTVIYGHNMLNEFFFSRLKDYLDEEFRNSHSEIQIYTPEHIFTYKVVCAVTYDNRHLLYTYDCSDTYEYDRFLSSLQTERQLPSWIEEPFSVTAEDRMIILSTCNGNPDQRFLVGAVLVNEE